MDDRHLLIRGLVGGRHVEAYSRNATFYAAVNTLAQMLPLWVNALAEQALENDLRMAALLKEMETGKVSSAGEAPPRSEN